MARASIKDEFRIEQTMIRPSGNNPLKFSLDDDDALATLLGIGRRGGMPADEAIAEAFDDLRMHELATISAMQEAGRGLLAQFAPEIIEQKAGGGGLQIHPAQKKAKAWEAFGQLHKSVTQALSDDFDSVFGKVFARRYAQALEKRPARGRAGRRPRPGAVPPALLPEGCGGPPPPPVVDVTLKASPDINPNPTGTPVSVAVRFYSLNARGD